MRWQTWTVPWVAVMGISAACWPRYADGADDDPSKQNSSSTLFLTAQEPDMSKEAGNGKLLVRELARQAVLIAARDQLGLSTRDMTLRESMPAGADDRGSLLDLHVAEGKDSVRVVVGRGETKYFEREFALMPAADVFDYVAFAGGLSEFVAGDLVEALKQAGFQGRANPIKASSEIPPRIEACLQEMNFFSQVSALRQLHALQHGDGESPQTLAALVRGYANLGQLTNFHWNATHKAFKARSLLYAQRLVKLDKGSAWSLRHRAYAETLIGLHAAALEDLKSARELAGAKDQVAAVPAWEPLMEALCRYDGKAVAQHSDAETRELAALVSFLIVENTNCVALHLTTGRQTLDVVPECYSVCDSMARVTGVTNQHTVTVFGPQVLGQTVSGRVREMSDLPARVLEALDKAQQDGANIAGDPAWSGGPQRVALIDALVAGGAADNELQEPSWELLGRLLEDVTFAHVYRRLYFFNSGLGLPPASYQDEFQKALALVVKHPYRAIVECMPLNTTGNADRIQKVLGQMRLVDADMFVYAEVVRYWNLGPSRDKTFGPPIWASIVRHNDHIAQDCERVGNFAPEPTYGRRLRIVSPYSPQAIAFLVAKDPTISQPKMKQWEQEFGDRANVLMALATRYGQQKRAADAERCLLRYAQQAPDVAVYQALAYLYQQTAQTDKWKDALEESLKYEDFALSHATSRVSIAGYFMDREQWKDALVYADEAAQTGAGWALICAAACHEALEQWDESEQLTRLNAERYVSQQSDWYFWCRRTGHGDVEGAQKLAAKRATSLALGGSATNHQELAIYYVLAGQSSLARSSFRRAFRMSGDLYAGLQSVLLNDEAQDNAERKAALGEVLERAAQMPNKNALQAAEASFAKWLNDAYDQAADAEPEIDSLNLILTPLGKENLANLAYFAGRYFELRGKLDLARKYYDRCVQTHRTNKWNCTLAAVRLRELKGE